MNLFTNVLCVACLVGTIVSADGLTPEVRGGNPHANVLAVAASPPETSESDGEASDKASDTGNFQRGLTYLGKYHLLLLHFPIAFLLAAAVLQWRMVALDREDTLAAAMLGAGAAGAVIAGVLGWMLASDSVYFGDDVKLLFYHRWLGTSTAAFASIIFLLRKSCSRKLLAVLLTAAALMVSLAAHFGGSLVRGADFLIRY